MIRTLSLIAAETLRQEFEEEAYYDRAYRPSVNVKNYKWFPRDIPWDELAEEFDHADTVRTWIEHAHDSGDYDQLFAAEEIARECWWSDVTDEATEVFSSNVQVYGEGRQGGHLVVHGIGSPDEWFDTTCEHVEKEGVCYEWDCEDWDIPDVSRIQEWADFRSYVEAMKDDFAHMVGWHLIVNVHDPIHDLQGVI